MFSPALQEAPGDCPCRRGHSRARLAVSGASADPHAIDASQPDGRPGGRARRRRPRSLSRPPRSTRTCALRRPTGYAPTLEQQPVADEPSEPSGFDFVSAAIGAIAAGAVALLLMATLGLRRPPRRRPASA